MTLGKFDKPFSFLLALMLLAGIGFAVWTYSYRAGLDQLSLKGRSDLLLAADRLNNQLKRYQELAVMMADHPVLNDLAKGDFTKTSEANLLLLQMVDKFAALSLFYAAPDGTVLASSHGRWNKSLGSAAYFQRALTGALGVGHGMIGEFGRRGYIYAVPSFGSDSKVQAVLILIADIDGLESEWRGGRMPVYFVDISGRVFISNRSELLSWPTTEAEAEAPVSKSDLSVKIVGGHAIWRMNWGPYIPKEALHLEHQMPIINMTAEALIDAEPTRRIAWLQASIAVALIAVFGLSLFIVTQRRRALAVINAELEVRVADRTRELVDKNTELEHEINERLEAEAALKKAQDDLVQAGKLSALGQMSAGISHELNQPIMAIDQFARNSVAYLKRNRPDTVEQNLGRISEMAHRMDRIIKNLRAFARNESEPMNSVDIVKVINSTLELSRPRMRKEGVSVQWRSPKHPIHVLGGEVRLGQVMLNLIGNAMDAMSESEKKHIDITLRKIAKNVEIVISDTGPGIKEPEKIFDPFYTTKEVGHSEGMGLGLSISYGLVQSFGGEIQGRNLQDGGAAFTIILTGIEKEIQ